VKHTLLKTLVGLSAASCCLITVAQASETVWLDSLDLKTMSQGYGTPRVNQSVTGQPLSVGGRRFERGVGTHAASFYRLTLNGGTERFIASVAVDAAACGQATIEFQVVADGKPVFSSGVMKPGEAAKPVDVDLQGVQTLLLVVTDAGDGIACDHADWVDAQFTVVGAKPMPGIAPYGEGALVKGSGAAIYLIQYGRRCDIPSPEVFKAKGFQLEKVITLSDAELNAIPVGSPVYYVPAEPVVILTPKAGPAPRLNGPKVYGARPGHPFLYRIPAQGKRPMTFSARGLPKGLQLDAQSGIITGTTPARGEYDIILRGKNSHGRDRRTLKLVSGDTLALTPPMGWNSWYAHYDRITDPMMREAADIMIRGGMADVGYQYVNIDACWPVNPALTNDPSMQGPPRDAGGNILPNRKFPDMKAMTDYIHSRGLKAGIYSSPGPVDCMSGISSWQHEQQDAESYARWGFDFLKYDWCSYGNVVSNPPSIAEMKRPYQLMGGLLRQQPRDLVFNLCQYGMGDVWKWGAEVGGHSWRTGGDLGFELNRIFGVALKNCEYRDWQKPGAWNDPDYIQIGYVGSAAVMGQPEPCPLTITEQYSFMSLWALMASPIFYSGDMTKLDEFALNVLCNPEVIEVDQDPLGQCARVVKLDALTFVLVKDLADGTKAVGLCNAGETPVSVTARWSDVGVNGKQPVRDVWRQKDLGKFSGEFKADVGRHGVVLVKVGKPSHD
jgi:alpha-galactosidase